jgi:predicted permease
MAAVLAALLPVFFLIVAGFLLRLWLIRDDPHWIGVERLVYYVMFPALLVETLARADLSRVPVAGVGGALFGAVIVMSLICFALRPLLTRLKVDGPAFSSVFQGATRWQTFVALAVAGNLYGDLGLALASVALVAMIPALNVINVWVLAHYASPHRPDWRSVLLAIAQNPLIWSCVIGLAINLVALPIPQPINDFMNALGRSSLALGLLMVGAGLKPEGLLRPSPGTVVATTLKLAVMPVLAVGLALAFGLGGTTLAVVACCASVPAASNAYVLARQMGGDAPLMAQILTVETVLAVATMPVAIGLTAALGR